MTLTQRLNRLRATGLPRDEQIRLASDCLAELDRLTRILRDMAAVQADLIEQTGSELELTGVQP